MTGISNTPVVAFGPVMPGWGSWEWVGADVCREVSKHFRTAVFEADAIPEADVVVVIKHVPGVAWMHETSRRSKVVVCPIDYYGSPAQIDADGAALRRCARIVVHSERLRRYFEPYAPVVYMDHHVKFASEPPSTFREQGLFLWVGVRTNLPPLLEWVNEHPLPGELLVLTNLEDPEHLPTSAALGFRRDQ